MSKGRIYAYQENIDYLNFFKKNTQLFGAHHNIPSNLVGLLFHQGKCMVKARLLKDSGTYQHAWIGNEEAVKGYSACMQAINEIDEISFKDKIQNTTRTNEVLAKLNKEALLAIVIAGPDTTEARQLAISRQLEIKINFLSFYLLSFMIPHRNLQSLMNGKKIHWI